MASALKRATGYVVLGKLERPTASAFVARTIQLIQH